MSSSVGPCISKSAETFLLTVEHYSANINYLLSYQFFQKVIPYQWLMFFDILVVDEVLDFMVLISNFILQCLVDIVVEINVVKLYLNIVLTPEYMWCQYNI